MSFIHTDADHFAKLSLHDNDVELTFQRPEHQPADEAWSVDIDETDKVNEVDLGDEDMTASEQKDGLTQLDFTTANDDSGHNASDGVNCAVVTIPQKRAIDEREKTYGIAKSFQAIKRQVGSIPGGAQQERSRVAASVVVNVPHVPDSWRNVPLIDVADEKLVALPAEETTFQSSTCTGSRRGRPRGSRNRVILRRERRRARPTKIINC